MHERPSFTTTADADVPAALHVVPARERLPLAKRESFIVDEAAERAKALRNATVIVYFRDGRLDYCDVNEHRKRVA